MGNLLRKELRLSASILSYLFIPFGLMFLVPGYPILCGAFFVTLGIFQSFQQSREQGDILFSVLLPVSRRNVVLGKYLFSCMIELSSVALMAAAVWMRMTVFSQSAVYRSNPMMNANFFALAMAFVIFGVFNWLFLGGFFQTAYQLAKPFVRYIVAAFFLILAAETLHHLPGWEGFNAFGWEHISFQLGLLGAGIGCYLVLSVGSYQCACRAFEAIDL